MASDKELARNIAQELLPLIQDTKREWIRQTVIEVSREVTPEFIKEALIAHGLRKDPTESQEDMAFLRNMRENGGLFKKSLISKLADVTVASFFIGIGSYLISVIKS